MTIDFQTNILKYLLQTPNGGQYFQYLDSSLFDLVVHRIAFDTLQKYFKQYGDVPTPTTAEKLLQDDIDATDNLPEELSSELHAMFSDFKEPLNPKDRAYIEDVLIFTIQEQQTDKYIMSYGDRKLSLDQLTAKLGQLKLMKQSKVADADGLLIEDRKQHNDDLEEGAPTFLHDLNYMTAAEGFYSPQLIIFASGPKHFKTGFIIKLAVEYARDGYKVYYADGENGVRSIRRRAKMSIMECSAGDLRSNPDLEDTLNNFNKGVSRFPGGDLFVDYWPASTATVGDVKNRLTYIKETKNWEPDIIIWDSIDHFLPTNPDDQRRDIRIQIQKVYHEVIALNAELSTFSIAPSQVNKKAIDKKVFDLKDLSEDFGKVMNAHAVFAICATPEELEEGLRRVVAVVQREGERYDGKNHCLVKIKESEATIKEVDKAAWYKDETDD
jgi:KaiC/GvpD/RAD55 family RecA-like ATPase